MTYNEPIGFSLFLKYLDLFFFNTNILHFGKFTPIVTESLLVNIVVRRGRKKVERIGTILLGIFYDFRFQ